MIASAILAVDAMQLIDPVWIAIPSAMDMVRAYPVPARDQMLDVAGTLKCVVTDKGRLADCVVTYENPVGVGGADALLKLATKFKMKLEAADGRPVAGRSIRMPIRFMLETTQAPPIEVPIETGLLGTVILDCRLTLESRLDNCIVRSSHRSDEGIGRAAIEVAQAVNAHPPAPPPPRSRLSRITVPIVFVPKATK